MSAHFVVGADGMHSIVREADQIPIDGGSYDQSFVLADVAMQWPPDDEVELFSSSEGLVVVAPLPEGHYRVVATQEHAPEKPGKADIQAFLDARGPKSSRAIVDHVVWSSRYHVHHRVARRVVDGRLLLAGDAAHVHSPAGGQGMTTGIQAAVPLAGAIREAIQSGTGRARLDRTPRFNRWYCSQIYGALSPAWAVCLLSFRPDRLNSFYL